MSTADLTAKQRRFVEEFLVDLNATQAAIRAGYSEASAGSIGHETLTKPEIQLAISEAQAARSARTAITADKVLERWWNLATANVNELMSFRRCCCRHCWGEGHLYQWIDEEEYGRACEKAVEREADMPSDEGGYGYRPTRAPHPECTHCEGVGFGHAHFEDTRTVRGPAELLFAGVKTTKDGVEMKVHDQAKALENVARHLGMFVDKSEVAVKHSYSEIGDDELEGEIVQLIAQMTPKG